MKKLNWQTEFLQMVGERATEPFVWGQNDCALFAADAVKIMTGTDYAEEFRGKYKTEAGAKRQLAKASEDGLVGILNDKLEPIDPNLCQRGDVILFRTDLGPTTGIYWHGGAFTTSPDGVKLFDSIHNDIIKAWRV